MIKTTYQTPELRNANDEVVQEGSFGKNTALTNSTNDGWIDYVMNDLEALHDTIGDSAPTLDGNGHVVEPANLAIGDEDGVRLKTGYLKTSGGTVSGTLNVAQNLKLQDNQENVFGGMYVPASSATSQFLQLYGGETPSSNGGNLQLPSDGSWTLQAKNGSTAYNLVGGTDGTLKWRGNNVAVTASPAFTGTPTAPTQATNNNSTRLATTAFVTEDLKSNAILASNTFATQISSGDDLNDYKTPGTYIITSSTVAQNVANVARTDGGCKLIVSAISGSNILQISIHLGRYTYVRTYSGNSGSWGAWKQIALAEDVLPLTGGTLTGNIIRAGSGTLESFKVLRTDLVKGTSPSAVAYTDIGIIYAGDTNTSNRLAIIENTLSTTGATSFSFRIYKFASGSTESRAVTIGYDASSEPYTVINTPILPGSGNDNAFNLGSASARWKQLFAGTTTISTSDERLKDNIVAIPDEVLDAWGEVGWYQYQFKDSIEEKGESRARLHTGAIAQRIESVFTSHGLDANKYGLLCYDEWKSEPAERDEDGNIVQPARPAGNRYSLRYEEALCMEAAYQRRRADRLESRIEALERMMNNANG